VSARRTAVDDRRSSIPVQEDRHDARSTIRRAGAALAVGAMASMAVAGSAHATLDTEVHMCTELSPNGSTWTQIGCKTYELF
jgi:hypothetical protein